MPVTPIPLIDGATAQEKAAFTRDSILAASAKYTVLAIEDDAAPGTPARLAKARDALGFVRENVFVIESRYVDPSAFLGGKCLEGGVLPPPFPLDAGLPALPAGSAYFRGDLGPLQSALNAAGNKIAVAQAGSNTTGTVRRSIPRPCASIRTPRPRWRRTRTTLPWVTC